MINTLEFENVLNKAVEYYNNTTDSLTSVCKIFKISQSALKSRLLKNGIEIRGSFKRNPSKLDSILKILTIDNVCDVAKQYNFDESILKMYLQFQKTEVKKYAIQCAVQEYVDTNRIDRNIKRISQKFGLNPKTLSKYLKQNNVDITCNGAALHVREDAFNQINTEEKAYWLGFLYADGYICKNSNAIGLSLSLKDIGHLEKFNKFLEYSGGLSISKTHQFGTKSCLNSKGETLYMVSTEIKNTELWNALNNAGCIPNKTLQLMFPDEKIFQNKRNLIYAFIRGYFDGDGTLGMYQHSERNKNKEESLMFVGTKPFLLKIQEYLGSGFLMQKTNCNSLVYRLSYSTKKANLAAQLMYENANIYLDRKYNIYKNEFAPKSGKNGEG